MSNPNETPVAPVTPLETPTKSRLRSFMDNHPRATRVAGITAAVTVVAATVAVVKNRKKDSDESQDVIGDEFTLDTDNAA